MAKPLCCFYALFLCLNKPTPLWIACYHVEISPLVASLCCCLLRPLNNTQRVHRNPNKAPIVSNVGLPCCHVCLAFEQHFKDSLLSSPNVSNSSILPNLNSPSNCCLGITSQSSSLPAHKWKNNYHCISPLTRSEGHRPSKSRTVLANVMFFRIAELHTKSSSKSFIETSWLKPLNATLRFFPLPQHKSERAICTGVLLFS